MLASFCSYVAAYEGASTPVKAEPAHVPQLTKAPQLLKFVDAEYPQEALAQRQSSSVTLQIDIGVDGKPAAVAVVRSGGEKFDQSAIKAVKAFEFSPAEVDNRPSPIRIEYVYHFEPKPAVAEPSAPAIKPVNLKGRVLQRGSRDPVAGATVFLPDHNMTAESDRDGYFEIRGVPVGNARIEIVHLKHRKYSTAEEIKPDEQTEIVAYIWKRVESGFELVVVGEREKKEVVRRTLQKEELLTVPGTFGDPLRVLQNLPGMARPPLISGALLVRGAQPQDSLVFIDGIPIPLLYHFGGGPSVLSPSFINQIDFYPGTYGARYGRAIGGVIDVDTTPRVIKRLHGNANVDFLNASFYIESPLSTEQNYGTLSLAARRSYIDAWLPTLIDQVNGANGGASIVALPYYWDFQSRYEIKLDGHRFELFGFGSYDSLRISQSGSVSTQVFSLDLLQGFNRFGGRWAKNFGYGWSAAFSPTVGKTVSNLGFSDVLKTTVESYDGFARGHVRKEFTSALSFESGIDVSAYNFVVHFETPGQPTIEEPNPAPSLRDEIVRAFLSAGYLESVWSPTTRWKWIPGLRGEVYKLPGGRLYSLEPRFASRFEWTPEFILKGGIGIYRQAPSANQLDSVTGNPYLGLAQSQQVGAGFEYRFTPKLSLDMQGFYSRRTNLVVTSTALVDRNGTLVPERYKNTGRGRAYGMEVLLKHDLTEQFYGWVAYTLSKSEQINERTGEYASTNFDQTNILTIVGSYKFESGWELGTRFRYTTGRPETPVTGATLDSDTGQYRAEYGAPSSSRATPFNQLDVRIEKQFTYHTWRFSTYLDVQNVFNAENPELTLWDYRYRDSAPLHGLPVLPTLGVKGEF